MQNHNKHNTQSLNYRYRKVETCVMKLVTMDIGR